MRKTSIKGFTLIELIVVMATFSIILFGAMQLMPHVERIMILSDVRQDGHATVSNISDYIKSQLSPVEYLNVKNYAVSGAVNGEGKYVLSNTDDLEEFVRMYYEGIVKQDTDPTSFSGDATGYGNGKIHVLTVNNAENGKISHYVYSANFKIGAPNLKLESSEEFAVNRAYYDVYDITVRPGMFTENDMLHMDPDDASKLLDSFSVNNTSFTITATTTRNHQDYSFTQNTSMSLVNLYKRSDTGVPGVYFVINETSDGATPPTYTRNLVDITAAQSTYSAATPLSRHSGQILKGSYVEFDSHYATPNGYTFIYSYGAEIDS